LIEANALPLSQTANQLRVVCGRRKSSGGLNGQYDKAAATPRSKCWPPSYRDPPPLIVTDYGVCRASTPTTHHAVDDAERPNAAADDDPVDTETGDPLCQRASPVVITVIANDDVDDSQRLLSQKVDTVPSSPSTDGTVPLSPLNG